MSWATYAIKELQEGNAIKVRPKGNSMKGLIDSGQLVQIRPLNNNELILKGDIVLCRVKGIDYLHLVSAVNNNRYQISNNSGHVNGWITRSNIYGIYIKTL